MSKKILGLLGIVVLVLLVGFFAMPAETRGTFLTEFVYRTRLMFGYKPEPITGADGSSGLRIEHPEEYGLPHGEGGEEHVDGEDADSEHLEIDEEGAGYSAETVDVEGGNEASPDAGTSE